MASPARPRHTRSRRGWRASLPTAVAIAAAPPHANDNPATAAPQQQGPKHANDNRPKRHVSLFQLLRWTYAEQRAHRYLAQKLDWLLWSFGQAGLLSNPDDVRPVHYDAAVVHGEVLGLPIEWLGLVLGAAMTGDEPLKVRAEDIVPLPAPTRPFDVFDLAEPHKRVEHEDGRVSYHDAKHRGGERDEHLVMVAEVISIAEQEFKLAGRKKMRRARLDWWRFEVRYCPLNWSPDPELVALRNREAETYQMALAELRRRLRGMALRAHVLAG